MSIPATLANDLFWVVQEEALSDEEVFLAADSTPLNFNSIHAMKSKVRVTKERHRRLLRRMVCQNADELQLLQRDFARSIDRVFLPPKTKPQFEIRDGRSFLLDNQQLLKDTASWVTSVIHGQTPTTLEHPTAPPSTDQNDTNTAYQETIENLYQARVDSVTEKHRQQLESLRWAYLEELTQLNSTLAQGHLKQGLSSATTKSTTPSSSSGPKSAQTQASQASPVAPAPSATASPSTSSAFTSTSATLFKKPTSSRSVSSNPPSNPSALSTPSTSIPDVIPSVSATTTATRDPRRRLQPPQPPPPSAAPAPGAMPTATETKQQTTIHNMNAPPSVRPAAESSAKVESGIPEVVSVHSKPAPGPPPVLSSSRKAPAAFSHEIPVVSAQPRKKKKKLLSRTRAKDQMPMMTNRGNIAVVPHEAVSGTPQVVCRTTNGPIYLGHPMCYQDANLYKTVMDNGKRNPVCVRNIEGTTYFFTQQADKRTINVGPTEEIMKTVGKFFLNYGPSPADYRKD
ncbi:uncharacterized protein BYT42DRAFT_275225 [Radiomyces spectabilis]|uniref:uncharacterized protein n=1 Tax=Radiomyces spectabilis TaxID=64574 RepID=UPI0022205C0F|nr:uncharacterized protein BYT42DRAFT_275225 [Radiomyces spectabilis]KAI8384814.1 hypothetical protein BYT42DRAFT_275225 [Radiomyces spectabilis]